MKLIWTPAADVDRDAIYDHIEFDNPGAAAEMDFLFRRRTGQLVAHPRLGRPGRAAGTRELVVHPSYLIIYELIDDTIWILRVLHTARQWPPAED